MNAQVVREAFGGLHLKYKNIWYLYIGKSAGNGFSVLFLAKNYGKCSKYFISKFLDRKKWLHSGLKLEVMEKLNPGK